MVDGRKSLAKEERLHIFTSGHGVQEKSLSQGGAAAYIHERAWCTGDSICQGGLEADIFPFVLCADLCYSLYLF